MKIHTMKATTILVIALLGAMMLAGFRQKETHVVMETTMGTIELKLYDETPLHRDNFIRLVQENAFDSLLFHRVIQDFMIQGVPTDANDRPLEDVRILRTYLK